MKQSDIDERVKELTTEAEMLGKQKRMLELLEECAKYGYEVELVDAHHPDLFDGPPYVTLRCKRSGVWCTVGSKKMLEGHEWESSTWYFPDGIFGDGWVKVSDIWEGIEPPAPQSEEDTPRHHHTVELSSSPPPPPSVQSEKTESGAYRVSWGGLGKKKEAKE